MEGHVALEPAAEDASGGTSQLGHTGTESGLDSGYLSAKWVALENSYVYFAGIDTAVCCT